MNQPKAMEPNNIASVVRLFSKSMSDAIPGSNRSKIQDVAKALVESVSYAGGLNPPVLGLAGSIPAGAT